MLHSSAFLNPQAHRIFSPLPNFPSSVTQSKVQFSRPVKFPCNFYQSSQSVQSSNHIPEYDLEEHVVVGDCLVFEEGIFEDPIVLDDQNVEDSNSEKPRIKPNSKKNVVEIVSENLVPDKWREAQAEINITKEERRKIAQELEFNSKVEKKKKGLVPLRSVNLEEYKAFKEAKLAKLKPLVLDNPSNFPVKEEVPVGKEGERGNESTNERVEPKNPRWAVYGRGLDDVTEFFNSGNYDPSDKSTEGRRKLFTKEEKVLLNKRIPDLAGATSDKWLPLHTLAASGEFYLLDSLLKHNVDINAVDKDGLTALHKAIIGKKQAITNYLLRNSANPFVRDKDGATLMHYAVQTTSSQAIKILLLYNVDINLPDNDGWTPLHLAVQARRTDLVRLLLIKGANKTLKNKDNLSPLDLCLYSGQNIRTYELVKLLKQHPRR
ncbi:hypothetical protein L6164_020215 [Bauhinia variegata]|uniref:Uncharacterized protein n=1 Tax=Bauhinia variegata TaxID=167791 RepID=A0ACB9MV56_BAUVA|nr:hypothetical protein L6164_020215 [Bauhinia variegata]